MLCVEVWFLSGGHDSDNVESAEIPAGFTQKSLNLVPAFLNGGPNTIFDYENDNDVDSADCLHFVPRFLAGSI